MTVDRPIEELDLPAWVGRATPDKRNFREAVHIVLAAISTSVALRTTMVMKGGMLMAIRYDSSRFTKDADFSTREKYVPGAEAALITELEQQLVVVNDQLPYDTLCRLQRYEVRPSRADAKFPTLGLNIGYAPRSKAAAMAKLLNKQAPTVVQIDYSYNEAVLDVEVLALADGEELQAYSFLNLLAEKLRSLLQQPIRNRNRRQDVYDVQLLVNQCTTFSKEEQVRLLEILIASCQERDIEATQTSMADPKVRGMAEEGYVDLQPEIEGALPSFEDAYSVVQTFYEELPWPPAELAEVRPNSE